VSNATVRIRPSEQEIRALVETFYAKVREDELLGPVFARHLDGAWPAHLDRMVDFWATVLLGAASFRGDPVARHAALPEIGPGHFDRWLELFEETLRERFSEPTARDILGRAMRMRRTLENASTPDATHQLTVLTTTRTTR